MSTSFIFSSTTFGKWKQEARAIKRTGIPHHQALEQVAIARGFKDWHQVVVEAKNNRVTEQAYRTGVLVAYDIKDAMDNWRSDDLFVDDYRAWHFCEKDLFADYLASDEAESGEKPTITDQYREEFQMFLTNVHFFRFSGANLPSNPRSLLPLLNERCFFAPMYIWYAGRFIDPWEEFAVDGVLDMSRE